MPNPWDKDWVAICRVLRLEIQGLPAPRPAPHESLAASQFKAVDEHEVKDA
jgi:hypothetical protein